jgi:hypothetical protein
VAAELSDRDVAKATLAIVCLSNDFGGTFLALIAEVALYKAHEASEDEWVKAVRDMRESLVERQALAIEDGSTDEERIAHFAKHMTQINEAIGLD